MPRVIAVGSHTPASALARLVETVLARLGVPAMLADRLAFVPLVAPRRERRLGILRLAGQSLSPAAQAMRERLLAHAQALQAG